MSSVLSSDILSPGSGGGQVPLTALRLADFTQFEPGGVGTFMSTPPVDLGGELGWRFSVLGGVGKSVADPFDGWYAVANNVMTDITGGAIAVANAWNTMVQLVERAPPDLSSDIQVFIGVMNEAQDSASVRAASAGILYTAASRGGRRSMVVAGTATIVGGANNASTRYILDSIYKVGTGAASVVVGGDSRTLDSNRAPLAVDLNTGAQVATAWGDVAPRLFIAVHRTSTTDTTTRVLDTSFYAQPPMQTAIPA